jgi:putative transposase
LFLEEANLNDAMRDLFARYATRFNRKYGWRGHLFGGPHRQAICLDDSYLIAASLYLHLNPVRANLADDLTDFHSKQKSVKPTIRRTVPLRQQRSFLS